MRFLFLTLFFLVGCAATPPVQQRTLVYECSGGYDITVRENAKGAELYLTSGPQQLKPLASRVGRLFSTAGVELRLEEETASLTLKGRDERSCRRNRRAEVWQDARIRGIDFRASGNKPGWFVELKESELTYAGDYGKTILNFTDIIQQHDDQQAKITLSGAQDLHRIELSLQSGICRDSISGETFYTRVTLELDGQTVYGCGKNLQ